MTDLHTRLVRADPLGEDDAHERSFEELWRRFEATSSPEPGSASRTARSQRRSGAPRAARWAALGVVAAAAAALLIVGTTGDGPANAFAGWTADPTTPPAGQVQAAEADCQQSNPQLGSTAPALVDTRGPWTVLIYPANELGCMVNPSTQGFGDKSPAEPFSLPGLSDSAPVSPDGISPMRGALVYAGPRAPNPASSVNPKPLDAQWTFTAGRVGADVTALTVLLSDGTSVEATVTNGWFAAWWPGGGAPQTAHLTTATGTTTQPYYGSTPAGTTSG